MAGASSASTRSRRTGTCRGAAVPAASSLGFMRFLLPFRFRGIGLEMNLRLRPDSVIWVSRDVWFPPPTPGAGEGAPGAAGGSHTPRVVAASDDAGQDLLGQGGELLLLAGEVGGPGLGVPDLHARVGTDDHAVTVEPGVVAQRTRDRHPTLLVRHVVVRGGEEHAAVVAGALRRQRDLTESFGQSGELGGGKDIEASLLPLCHHESLRQLVPELGRQEQPALVVETWRVGAEEHAPPPTSARRALPVPLGSPMSGSISRHCTPLCSPVNQIGGGPRHPDPLGAPFFAPPAHLPRQPNRRVRAPPEAARDTFLATRRDTSVTQPFWRPAVKVPNSL